MNQNYIMLEIGFSRLRLERLESPTITNINNIIFESKKVYNNIINLILLL